MGIHAAYITQAALLAILVLGGFVCVVVTNNLGRNK